ncbi:MAG: gamma-glutamyl-gamma-aminobutyrate hydrolase family protein [Erysipelotrichaceae bacterium]|nr:gamma-glutamyl-gamma-aminobutyrate hydrolase family protein [Erysipelotrichaceae bacterium]
MKKGLKLLVALLMVFALFGCTTKTETVNEPAKVKVGVSWAMDESDAIEDEDIQAYVESIKLAGGEPVYMEQATDLESAIAFLANVDCIIMAGGEDVNPAMYGEEMLAECEEPYDERDTSDFWYIKAAIEMDMPLLATCRGMQMLNVVCGGTLYQDLFTQYDTEINHRDPELEDFTYHTITIEDGNILAEAMGGAGEYTVNSWHHQGIKTVGEGLSVVALAEDGMIEGLIYDNASYIYGTQFHPEWHVVEETLDCLPVFTALMEAASK